MATPRPGRVPRGSRGAASLRAVPVPAISQAYRGRKRDALLLDLAMQALSTEELASREGVDAQALEDFQQEFQAEILAIREAMVDRASIDTAGLWISDKRARLAEYQAEIEEIGQTLETLRESGIPWSRSHRDMDRIRMDLYRMAADELGAYPQRQAAPARQGTTVHYVIETDDTEALT